MTARRPPRVAHRVAPRASPPWGQHDFDWQDEFDWQHSEREHRDDDRES